MKSTFSIIIIFIFSTFYSQEFQSNKVKIGKYNYEIYLKGFYNYEIDEYGINYYIRLNGKESFIGSFLSYRTFLKSRNTPIFDDKLPANPLLKFKDREVTGEGKIEIKKDKKEIINTFIKYTKAHDEDSDSTKSVYRQGKNGYFRLVSFTEYRKGTKKTVIEK